MAFEAEMWGDFVTVRVKNHSEGSGFISELCLEMWRVTRPGKVLLQINPRLATQYQEQKGALNYLNIPKSPQTEWDTDKPRKTIIWGINRGKL